MFKGNHYVLNFVDDSNSIISGRREEDITINTIRGKVQAKKEFTSLTLLSLADDEFSMDCNRVMIAKAIPGTPSSIPTNADLINHSHLSDVTLNELPPNSKIHLLVGTDLARGLLPLDGGIRRGSMDSPSAVKTAWGWSLLGPEGSKHRSKGDIVCTAIANDNELLHQKLDIMYKHDFNEPPGIKDGPSVEDQQALKVIESSCILKDGKFQFDIPWRGGREVAAKMLPTAASEKMARNRTIKLGEKMKKDPATFEMVCDKVNHLLEKGYATKVPDEELEPKEGEL